jgi:hypothetical protein
MMHADPALAEQKRQRASARFVHLCRSEDGINTLIARADQGDLVMVYALVDRLADILALDGSTEAADERRATAFGLLAQPAMILELLLRHAAHDAPPAPEGVTAAESGEPAAPDDGADPLPDLDEPANEADDQAFQADECTVPPAPVWDREPDDLDAHPPDGSGLRLDLPGLADLISTRGLRAARPRVVLNVLATQLREFLITHSCHLTLRPGAGR